MPQSHRQVLGQYGEEWANLFLQACGFELLARRFRRREGEIDLVMQRGGLVVFVEVKTRRSRRCGGAADAVTSRKLLRMRAAARRFLLEHPLRPGVRYRFDVIAIQHDGEGRGCCLVHYPGVGV